MKDSLKALLGDPFCLWSLIFSLIFLLGGVFFLIFFWSRLPPQVPLFYSQPWGEEQLAPKYQIWLLPVFSSLIFLVNLSASLRFLPKEPLLARILIGAGAILVLTLLTALFQIVNLII